MTVIVTGASRGIGRVIADRLHSLGYEVLGIATENIRDKDYDEAPYSIEECDVSNIQNVRALYEKVKHKKISGLVNSAGIFDAIPFEFQPYERYERIIAINLLGTMNMCSIFLKIMDKEVHTPIINMFMINIIKCQIFDCV
jgi:NAD(P)-dependent dehydrogenase (short-subunit alcohol dehydrogenase family)